MTILEPMKPTARQLIPLRVQGVFPQRQEDAFMVRVRIPSGLITPAQLNTVANVIENYSARNRAHFTMRQDIQIYETNLDDRAAIDAHLRPVGLTLRESGGNVIRNVTCCPYAGTSPHEPFDPTPYAIALADHFHGRTDVLCIRNGREITASTLPRKLKFAVGGCCNGTCGNTAINDLGFLAISRDGQPGFRVTIGGGLSARPRVADELFAFVPAQDILLVAEAVVRIFALHGTMDPSAKRSARLRHLVARMGVTWMQEQVERVCATLPSHPHPLAIPPARTPGVPAAPPAPLTGDPDCDAWIRSHVRPANHPHTYACHAANLHGDLSPLQLRTLADLARTYSAGDVRLTLEQGLLFRQVKSENVPLLWIALKAADLTPAASGASVTACPGLASCKYAIADTHAITARVDAWLAKNSEALADAGPIRFRVSGCPFSCGHHHVGTIGFYGTARTIAVGGRIAPVPLAAMVLGGTLGADHTHMAQGIIGIPPRKIPTALDRLLALYRTSRAPKQPFADWAASVDVDALRLTLTDLTILDPTDPELMLDLAKAAD